MAQAIATAIRAAKMTFSAPKRRPSAGATGPIRPKQSTGSVVRMPASVRSKPSDCTISSSSGPTLVTAGRRLSATRPRPTSITSGLRARAAEGVGWEMISAPLLQQAHEIVVEPARVPREIRHLVGGLGIEPRQGALPQRLIERAGIGRHLAPFADGAGGEFGVALQAIGEIADTHGLVGANRRVGEDH